MNTDPKTHILELRSPNCDRSKKIPKGFAGKIMEELANG